MVQYDCSAVFSRAPFLVIIFVSLFRLLSAFVRVSYTDIFIYMYIISRSSTASITRSHQHTNEFDSTACYCCCSPRLETQFNAFTLYYFLHVRDQLFYEKMFNGRIKLWTTYACSNDRAAVDIIQFCSFSLIHHAKTYRKIQSMRIVWNDLMWH